jgi:hypothetical protein
MKYKPFERQAYRIDLAFGAWHMQLHNTVKTSALLRYCNLRHARGPTFPLSVNRRSVLDTISIVSVPAPVIPETVRYR